MSGAVTKKLPKAVRREQLLETAQAIMRDEGTDALTLGHVAERAGVSKPIAYEHFGTRAGLLIALCSDYDQRQMQAQRKAIETGGETLEDAAAIFASAYVSCVLDMGPAMGAGYVERYREGFGRVVKLPDNDDAIFLGFLGAAEALAQDAAAGRVSREEAVEALSRIFTATLERYPRKGKAS
jgi:AcrR family transcriptional regulator